MYSLITDSERQSESRFPSLRPAPVVSEGVSVLREVQEQGKQVRVVRQPTLGLEVVETEFFLLEVGLGVGETERIGGRDVTVSHMSGNDVYGKGTGGLM